MYVIVEGENWVHSEDGNIIFSSVIFKFAFLIKLLL